jgi:ZIP family zinc transporter
VPDIVKVILIAFVAGAVGTGLGGILGVFIKKPKKMHIALMMAFAAGAMAAVSLFELLPEAYEGGGILTLAVGILLGAIVVYLFELIYERYLKKTIESGRIEELPEQTAPKEKKKLFSIGIAIFVAMMLHSLPEGIAIGAGYHADLGFLLGAIMLVHYIPEGLAIAVPLKASGMKNWKTVALSFSAGIPTLIGAIIGYFIGTNDVLIAYTLSFAAGVMLYIVFSQMLPIAYSYTNKHQYVTLSVLAGIIVTVLFAVILH